MQARVNEKTACTAPAANLAQGREALFASLVKTTPEAFILENAGLLDTYFTESFAQSRSGPSLDFVKNPFAVIALGGYGRSEQCVHSDVDVMILFRKSVPKNADELVRDIVYPLWDIGLEVGHAVRSIKECIVMARDDSEVLASFIDARFVCGMSCLFDAFSARIADRILSGRGADRVIRGLVDLNLKRHDEYGDSAFLLEPNLKEGAGGLRDYHILRWIGNIRFNSKTLVDLEHQGILTHHEYTDLTGALFFIWGVRNRLHVLTGRKCDRLYFDHQLLLANEMGYRAKNGQQPVERLMSELHLKMGLIKDQLLLVLYELGFEIPTRRRFSFSKKAGPEGILITKGGLEFSSSERIIKSPQLLIRIFETSAHLRVPLTREALSLVREFCFLVKKDYWKKPGVKEAFENILRAPVSSGTVFEQMLNSGLLTRLIPEFAAIVDRIQFDAYHIYPVGRHLIRTVQILKSFAGSGDASQGGRLAGRLFSGLKKKRLLLIAALIHDIGKGVSGDKHSLAGAEMVPAVLSRMGYDEKEIDTVGFLVEHHLLLVKTATRRDIYDEETALMVARIVGRASRLKMLYLLSISDAMATGPKAWNDWTSALLRGLFLMTMHTLENKGIASVAAGRRMAEKLDSVCGKCAKIPGIDAERIREILTPRYLLAMAADEILSHLRLYSGLDEMGFAWDISGRPDSDTRRVAICTKDRPGLFSAIAGVFALNGIEVLDAQIYTWKNNIALDVFTVHPPLDLIFEKSCWKKAAEDLRAAILNPAVPVMKMLKKAKSGARKTAVDKRPSRVVIDNHASSFFTIIEVFTHDSPGLLYRITDTLSRFGLDIMVAKIATKVDQVVDVFYVRDEGGGKLESGDAKTNLKKSLLAALEYRA
ncbi:MAG: [protein-PII] uridylyltransferase [Deltaproteobacteria bacterium]|nr:[protein-PII] uridylyltransferase [Deltaproteobacteria bacterium]